MFLVIRARHTRISPPHPPHPPQTLTKIMSLRAPDHTENQIVVAQPKDSAVKAQVSLEARRRLRQIDESEAVTLVEIVADDVSEGGLVVVLEKILQKLGSLVMGQMGAPFRGSSGREVYSYRVCFEAKLTSEAAYFSPLANAFHHWPSGWATACVACSASQGSKVHSTRRKYTERYLLTAKGGRGGAGELPGNGGSTCCIEREVEIVPYRL